MVSQTQTVCVIPRPSENPSTRRRTAAFATVALTQFLLIMAISIVVVPVTFFAERQGFSQSDIALITSGYGLVFSGLLLFGSRIGDKFGPRRALTLGLVVFAVGSLLGVVSVGHPMMVISRFIQGAGSGFAAPASMALVGRIYTSASHRRRALAVYGIMGSVGGTCGLLTSGLIAASLSWRWAFAVPAIAAASLALCAVKVVPSDSAPQRRIRLDIPGAVLATAGILGISYGLMRAGNSSFTAPDAFLPLGAGVLLLGMLGIVESRVKDPLLPLRFLLSRPRGVAWAGLLLITATNAVATLVLTLYFQQVRGFSAPEIVLAFLPFALVLGTGLFGGRMVAQLGASVVTAIGLFIATAGAALVATLEADGSHDVLLFIGMSLLPIGTGLTFSGTTVLAMSEVPSSRTGLAGGLLNTAIEIGAAGGVAILTAIIGLHSSTLMSGGVEETRASVHAYSFGFLVLALALAVGAICSLALAYRQRYEAKKLGIAESHERVQRLGV